MMRPDTLASCSFVRTSTGTTSRSRRNAVMCSRKDPCSASTPIRQGSPPSASLHAPFSTMTPPPQARLWSPASRYCSPRRECTQACMVLLQMSAISDVNEIVRSHDFLYKRNKVLRDNDKGRKRAG